MAKSCNNCFHCKVCTLADKDYDFSETCCEYINEDDVIVTNSNKDQFKRVTDEVFDLFRSFQKSGFSEKAAFELTTGYLGVAFERDAEWRRHTNMKKVTKPYR